MTLKIYVRLFHLPSLQDLQFSHWTVLFGKTQAYCPQTLIIKQQLEILWETVKLSLLTLRVKLPVKLKHGKTERFSTCTQPPHLLHLYINPPSTLHSNLSSIRRQEKPTQHYVVKHVTAVCWNSFLKRLQIRLYEELFPMYSLNESDEDVFLRQKKTSTSLYINIF